MSDHLIITKRRGTSWYLVWGVFVIVLFVVVFYFGRLDSREERLKLMENVAVLESQVADYQEQINILEQKNIKLQSSAQIESQASEEIMQTIAGLKQTIDSLDKELAFYRGIMAPEKDIKGLHVSDFTLKKSSSDRSYVFQLALTQLKKHDVFLKGDAKIVITGSLNGKPTQHNVTEVSPLSSKDLKFTFKYFQHIRGELVLPEGFEPQKIKVTATTTGRNSQTVTKEFNWAV